MAPLSIPNQALPDVELAGTGIAGLDDVLGGGWTAHRTYLIEGDPGAGKTTLALQFLLEGRRCGERCLYFALSETREELDSVVHSHGWSLDGIDVHEVTPADVDVGPDDDYTMFHPAEVEFGRTIERMVAAVEQVQATRVVFDSLSELRLLAQGPLRYRRQIIAIKQLFAARAVTVLLLDDRSAPAGDPHLRSIAHGVLELQQTAPDYGGERRRLRVIKLRGRCYRGGFHDFAIQTGGIAVYPRLVAAEHRLDAGFGLMPSDVPSLDAILGDGARSGTSLMITGPAGSGKSSIAMQFAVAAGRRGERAAIFTFDELPATTLLRSDALGLDLRSQIRDDRVRIRQVDPAELTPGEFMHAVRLATDPVEGFGARVVVIDSLNGYLYAMPNERFLIIQMHELLTYLNQRGVLTVLIVAEHGVLGANLQAPFDASYLADTVVLTRYYEADGVVHKAVSVVKHRTGDHDRTVRELHLGQAGLRIGDRVRGVHGVLTGQMLQPGGPGPGREP